MFATISFVTSISRSRSPTAFSAGHSQSQSGVGTSCPPPQACRDAYAVRDSEHDYLGNIIISSPYYILPIEHNYVNNACLRGLSRHRYNLSVLLHSAVIYFDGVEYQLTLCCCLWLQDVDVTSGTTTGICAAKYAATM